MWHPMLAAADDPSTVLPIVGGGGLSAVLFYLLLDSIKERRALQQAHDELLNRFLPAFTGVSALMERVLVVLERVSQLLSQQSGYRDPESDPEVLRRAYEQLRRVLEEHGDEPPPRQRRRRDP